MHSEKKQFVLLLFMILSNMLFTGILIHEDCFASLFLV
jgi:hypothetical protein